MARYFFDVRDRGRTVRDAFGMDLHDEAQAIHETSLLIEHLSEIAQVEGRLGTISVFIRSDRNICLYEASTSLAGDEPV